MSDASAPSPPPPQPLTLTVWLILAMAAIGFSCDIYVLLMLPLILPPALAELLPGVAPGSPQFNLWRGLMFWVPAIAGGVFGLVGGYLTDRLGRRRVLTWSILLYAFASFASAYATSLVMLLVLRCLVFIGVCVEFVAAVAWLAELFPNPGQRERALGYTQAFSSFGGLLVGGAFLLANRWAEALPAIVLPDFLAGTVGVIGSPHATWRYTLLSGVIPAIPLILVRPFLPESPVWFEKMQAGTLKRPSFAELFAPALRKTTLITTILVACSYGAAFGAIQQMPQIVPGLPEVRAEIAQKTQEAVAEGKAVDAALRKKITRDVANRTSGQLHLTQEIGGLIGRFLLALLVVRILSRQNLLRLFLVPGLLVFPFVFAYAAVHNSVVFTAGTWNVSLFHIGIFLAGLLTVAQFSFWGNYLPMAYPVHLRGTGESVAANVGSRMIGTSFAALTSLLSELSFIPGSDDPTRVAYAAAGVGLFVYLVAFAVSFFLPEPREEMLTE